MSRLTNNLSSPHDPHPKYMAHMFITIQIPAYVLVFGAIAIPLAFFGFILPLIRMLLSGLNIDAYKEGLRQGEERVRQNILQQKREEDTSDRESEEDQATLRSLHMRIDNLCNRITELKEEMGALRENDQGEGSDDDTSSYRSGYTDLSGPVVARGDGDPDLVGDAYEDEQMAFQNAFDIPGILLEAVLYGGASPIADDRGFGRFGKIADFMEGNGDGEVEIEDQGRRDALFAENGAQDFLETPD